MIKELLGVDINFEQLQNLFLGQSLLNVKEEKQDLDIVSNRYILSPEKQAALFDIFFTINPSHFKLDKQSIINEDKNLRLDVKYPSYQISISAVSAHMNSTAPFLQGARCGCPLHARNRV